jgi:hypothetical protein
MMRIERFGTGNVVYVMQGAVASTTSDSKRTFERKIRRKFDELCALPAGWDGYRSGPVPFGTANFAFGLTERIATVADAFPNIVPTSGGEIQAEWEVDGGVIELVFHGPLSASVYVEHDGHSEERELGSDFTFVEDWISNLREKRAVDEAAAA